MHPRATLTAFFVGAIVLAVAPGCGAGVSPAGTSDAGPTNSPPTIAEGLGDPCAPQVESDPSFPGFDEKEVSIEAHSPGCKTQLCMVNHFRGRTTCAYGQDKSGQPPAGGQACTPAVTGRVNPQCVDRSATKTVYCSCRCANVNGETNDGSPYCACSAGYECTSLVTSIGSAGPNDLAGSYCVKRGTAYNADTACSQGDCDPVTKKCL